MTTALTYGTLVLLAATLLNRLLSFYNQIVLMKYIGAETVGLFQMIYPVYILLLVAATFGIPVALTKRIAEEAAYSRWGNVRQLMQISLLLLAAGGTLLTLAALFFSPALVADDRATAAFWPLLPSILLICFASALRSFCQGMQEMMPTSIASFAEQVVRIVSGLSLALALLPRGAGWAAAGMSWGITLGELCGLLTLLLLSSPLFFSRLKLFWANRRARATIGAAQALRSLWPVAAPVAASRIVSCLIMGLDAYLIPRVLQQSGLTSAEATVAFGSLVGGLVPLIAIPAVFTAPLSVSLVPGIAESWALRQERTVRYRSVKALRLTAVIGWPAAVLLALIGDRFAALFFGLAHMGDTLHILAWGAPFLYLQSTTSGILQGLGMVVFPLFVTVATSLLRIAVFLSFATSPSVGLDGVAFGFTLSNVLAALLHLYWFHQRLGLTGRELASFLLPLPAALVLGAGLWVGLPVVACFGLQEAIALVPVVTLSTILYLGALAAYGGLTAADLRTFPGGNRLLGWIRKK
ncbi:oligosaccharide flippase family protein [Heliobacterium gestii]|uniref:Oligosaccharide flippase family protein n=1 Tax=Heliomicrobium gestii TaxID=2699 RepID=A0A845LAZ5_HELGE|nr:polysaccharide biosynthesis protein [Heliomicrobium gestii]MBM7867276.1 stage V sporulation protein B [Heliomicrobium gestii]MZP43832.1 oligosaccharide flippase family protein [Heliomicrobium gestii]